MAMYECPVCGHKAWCPSSAKAYKNFGFIFWCLGPHTGHGNKIQFERAKTYHRNSKTHHPIFVMKCIDEGDHFDLQKDTEKWPKNVLRMINH